MAFLTREIIRHLAVLIIFVWAGKKVFDERYGKEMFVNRRFFHRKNCKARKNNSSF